MKRRDVILRKALKIPEDVPHPQRTNIFSELDSNSVAPATTPNRNDFATVSPTPEDCYDIVKETSDNINSLLESDPNANSSENHEHKENSSPVPSMSPETLKLFEVLYNDENDNELEADFINEDRRHSLPPYSEAIDSDNTHSSTQDEPVYSRSISSQTEKSQDRELCSVDPRCTDLSAPDVPLSPSRILVGPCSVESRCTDLPTPDAPLYSPLTPAFQNINRLASLSTGKNLDEGPHSVNNTYADLPTPDAPLYSPITPVCQNPMSVDQNFPETKDNTTDDDFSNDDCGEDPNYTPGNGSSVESSSSETEIVNVHQPNVLDINQLSTNNNSLPNANEDNTTDKGRPKKGRKRKFEEYTLSERKNRKYNNLAYQGKSKEVLPKLYKEFNCSCPKKCFLLIDNEKREAEFLKFYGLKSYEAQLMYIVANVRETSTKRSYKCKDSKSGKNKPRTFSRSYSLCGVSVCKNMFSQTLQISNQKLTISLQKSRSGNINDQRGKLQGGWNKTPQEDVDFICNFINKIPKYESHYRRVQNSDRQYLQPEMTHNKLYSLYLEEFKKSYGESKKSVSFGTFKKIFLTKFNLTCKSLKKDTCNICDKLAVQIKCCTSDETKTSLLLEKENHLKIAETLRTMMNNDMENAKNDKTFECLTYDLEKTLPLPRIPTNIVFYKRQLWFYNCGVHVGSTNTGHCFVWVEGEAGRGAQEIGSCLASYIKNTLSQEVQHLVLWSDSCGGQNRNIKITLLLKAILENHPTLQTITFKYLQPGHTFLPNDTDFSKIETSLKLHPRLYTAQDYINVIKNCRNKNPLLVKKMESRDFLGTQKLEKNIVNRKVSVNKNKINWLKIKEILLKKENLYSIFIKTAEGYDEEINIGKKIKGKVYPINEELLIPLYPNGKEIAQVKLDDLKSLYPLIPEDCLAFYKSLKGNVNVLDDIDGLGSVPDFEIENPEED